MPSVLDDILDVLFANVGDKDLLDFFEETVTELEKPHKEALTDQAEFQKTALKRKREEILEELLRRMEKIAGKAFLKSKCVDLLRELQETTITILQLGMLKKQIEINSPELGRKQTLHPLQFPINLYIEKKGELEKEILSRTETKKRATA